MLLAEQPKQRQLPGHVTRQGDFPGGWLHLESVMKSLILCVPFGVLASASVAAIGAFAPQPAPKQQAKIEVKPQQVLPPGPLPFPHTWDWYSNGRVVFAKPIFASAEPWVVAQWNPPLGTPWFGKVIGIDVTVYTMVPKSFLLQVRPSPQPSNTEPVWWHYAPLGRFSPEFPTSQDFVGAGMPNAIEQGWAWWLGTSGSWATRN